MQKRILFLGGSYYQIPPLRYAKQQGHYVITCDYLPENPGHYFADEYHNVSTTDKAAVLQLAQRLNIDGIVAFASDPSAPSAAYVANRLKLPGNPYESAVLLTRKDLFREFLAKNNFNVPKSKSFNSPEEAEVFFKTFDRPAIVKPADASGSKGVSKITKADQLENAYKNAFSFSRIGRVVVEEFIEKKGYQIAGDGFVYDGKLVFRCFAQEHFNNIGNPFVPIGESFPLLIPESLQTKIHQEVQRLLTLLNMRVGALNFDIMLDRDDKVFLIEVAPRSGGNLISEVIRFSTGIDIAKYSVDGALNIDCTELGPYKTAEYCSCYMLHTRDSGVFKGVELDSSIRSNIIEKQIFIKEGALIQPFESANYALGCLILKYSSPEEMLEKMETMDQRVKIILA
jgi:biotin carboxylase